MIHKSKPEKKEGLGVFAKILAGLLRKAGEKDGASISLTENAADTKIRQSGVPDPESLDSQDLSTLFPGLTGWAKGKKAAKTGTPEPGTADGLRALGNQNGKPAEETADREKDDFLLFGNPLYLPETLTAQTADKAEGAALLRMPKNEAVPVEPGFDALLAARDGLSAGAGPDGAVETGETRINRKGKAGDKTKSPGFSEEIAGLGQDRDAPDVQLSDMRKPGNPEGGKEGTHNRLAESRSRDKRRDRINLEVRDLRTGDGQNSSSSTGPVPSQHNAGARLLSENGETDITLELRGDNPGREAPDSAQKSWETRSTQSFEQILARELHENLNGDIVRHASVVLRDHGQGTIRLSLKPESLGNVKIRLEMAENKITGHIVVESEEALRAFEREARSLEQAFRDSGFDGAELDMSLAQGGGGAEQRRHGEGTGRPGLSERLAASQYDAAAEHAENPGLFTPDARDGMYTRNGRIAVNMLI
jgi:hypothetical protein